MHFCICMSLGCKCKLKGFDIFGAVSRSFFWYFPYLWCFSWGSGLAKWGHCGRFLLGRKAGLPLRHGHNQTASMIANAQRKQKKEVSNHTFLNSFERELFPLVQNGSRLFLVKPWLILVLTHGVPSRWSVIRRQRRIPQTRQLSKLARTKVS